MTSDWKKNTAPPSACLLETNCGYWKTTHTIVHLLLPDFYKIWLLFARTLNGKPSNDTHRRVWNLFPDIPTATEIDQNQNISLTSAALKQRKCQKGVCWTSCAVKVQRFVLSVHSTADGTVGYVSAVTVCWSLESRQLLLPHRLVNVSSIGAPYIANKSQHIPARVLSMCVFEKWVLYFLCIKSFSNLCCRTRSTLQSHTVQNTHSAAVPCFTWSQWKTLSNSEPSAEANNH